MIKWKSKVSSNTNGVYGIYLDNKLIYIGSTIRSFEKRLKEHNKNLQQNNKMPLYNYIRRFPNVQLEMRPMIVLQFLQTRQEVNLERLGWMELALISCFRPKCNINGLKSNFVFHK